MNNLINITWLGMFFGLIGTTLGGVVGTIFKINNNKTISFVLEFASGLMTSIICFDLIPSSLEISSITNVFIGMFCGILFMVICDEFINRKMNKVKTNSMLKTGIIVGVGLAIHNFPEGLAIGSGFEASSKLGLSLAIAIAIHDFPEGISIAVPMSNGGVGKLKTIMITALSGVTTGIGAFFGACIGNISLLWIAISLSFAAGTMLYIVSCELIPEATKIYKGKFASFGFVFGIILGLFSKFL